MDQKYAEFIGVDSVYYALITADTDSAYTAGTPQYLAPVAEIAGEPEVNNKTTYYDNAAANNYVTEGKTELKVTVANVPAQLMATLLGKAYDAASGRVYDSGQANPPKVALGFRFAMGQDKARYYWFLAGTFSGGAEEATTKTSDVDEKTYTLTFTAVTTAFKWTVNTVLTSLKRTFADTSDSAFDPTGWFTQVQTPSTTVAPSAVSLSTIVPADGAASVARTSTIVLTFNNKIASEAITLINSTSGDTVVFTKAWDTAGKVLTITPSATLAATTKFIVAIAGVVDVYGQALAANGKDFTTAA